mmetsp:Transcript_105346/g.339779  ORF Transcript_105346/g.339779 Transcript_105346/m.339779 type:complete len:228 (+) Transcript_105346:725-1408(+)
MRGRSNKQNKPKRIRRALRKASILLWALAYANQLAGVVAALRDGEALLVQPRPACLQHHAFLRFDHSACQLSTPTWHLKGAGQRCSFRQHHFCLSSDQPPWPFSTPTEQSYGLGQPFCSCEQHQACCSADQEAKSAVQSYVGHPRCSDLQHHSLFARDQPNCQFVSPAWQLYGVLLHPACMFLQHHTLFCADQTPTSPSKQFQICRTPAATDIVVVGSTALGQPNLL